MAIGPRHDLLGRVRVHLGLGRQQSAGIELDRGRAHASPPSCFSTLRFAIDLRRHPHALAERDAAHVGDFLRLLVAVHEDQLAGVRFRLGVVVADPVARLDGPGVLPDLAAGIAAANGIAEPAAERAREVQLLELAVAEIRDPRQFLLLRRGREDRAEDLLDRLREPHVGGDLAQLVQPVDQDRMGNQDLRGRDPLRFAVAIDHADALLRIDVAKQAGLRRVGLALGVGGRDDQVAEHVAPIRIGPDRPHDVARHRQRTQHPRLDAAQALGPMVGQPLAQRGELLGQFGLFQLLRNRSQLLARGIAAHQLAGLDPEGILLVRVQPGDVLGCSVFDLRRRFLRGAVTVAMDDSTTSGSLTDGQKHHANPSNDSLGSQEYSGRTTAIPSRKYTVECESPCFIFCSAVPQASASRLEKTRNPLTTRGGFA